VLQLTEQVLASTLLAAVQALRLRFKHQEISSESLSAPVMAMYQDIAEYFPTVSEDRPLEQALRFTVDAIQTQRWALYE
jgi:histidine ammonia-lyase